MPKQTSLFLISGFLGSGKTTLVKQLLENASTSKVGVIMNEFGKVSIDGPIIQRTNLEMIELTRGSIFCSCLTMAFAEALVDMADKDLDHLIVESSGLADPSNIGDILAGVSLQVPNAYVYSGSITIVDASRFLIESEDVETIVKQVECSDLVFINKSDLVSGETLEAIALKIQEINPSAEIKMTSFFNGIEDVLGRDLSKGKYPVLRPSLNTPENKPKTMSLVYEGDMERSALEGFIRSVMTSAFRIKGFVRADDAWWEVHGVGDCVDFYETDRHFEGSTLVIISKIGPNIIRIVDSAWKAQLGSPMKMVNG